MSKKNSYTSPLDPGTIVQHNVRATCSCGWRSQLVDSRRIDASAQLSEALRMHSAPRRADGRTDVLSGSAGETLRRIASDAIAGMTIRHGL